MNILNWIALVSLLSAVTNGKSPSSRNKRYLLTPVNTQWGMIVALVLPLESNPMTTYSFYFGTQYYPVSNSSYWHPLFGDTIISRSREKRDSSEDDNIFSMMSRHMAYHSIEILLEKHGYPGNECMLRAICEVSKLHTLHNGLVGDLLYILLSPSSSLEEEDVDDMYYEAELMGLHDDCRAFIQNCPANPLDLITYGVFGYND